MFLMCIHVCGSIWINMVLQLCSTSQTCLRVFSKLKKSTSGYQPIKNHVGNSTPTFCVAAQEGRASLQKFSPGACHEKSIKYKWKSDQVATGACWTNWHVNLASASCWHLLQKNLYAILNNLHESAGLCRHPFACWPNCIDLQITQCVLYVLSRICARHIKASGRVSSLTDRKEPLRHWDPHLFWGKNWMLL